MNQRANNLARRYPITGFLCLTFLISWGGVFLAGGPDYLAGRASSLAAQATMGLLMLAGPSAAGLLMAYLTNGGDGLRSMFGRMRRSSAGGAWYLAPLVFPLCILTVALALSKLIAPAFSPVFFWPGIFIGLLAGFVEELGWTGFLLPGLISRYRVMFAAVLLGLLHAVWHIPADFLSHAEEFGVLWWPYFFGFALFVLALRILIAWVYANTGRLLLAQLMHASSTGFLAILISVDLEPGQWVLFYAVYAMVLVVVALGVIAVFGRDLVRPRNRGKPWPA